MKSKMLYVWIAIPVAVVVVWVLAFYFPLSAKIRSQKKTLLNIKQEVQRVDNDIKNFVSLKKKDNQALEVVKEYQTKIPVLDNLPDFVRKIIQTARNEGVVLTKFNSKFTSIENTSKSPIVTPVFEIGLKGRFIELGKFIEALEGSVAFNRVIEAHLSYDEKEYPMLTGDYLIEFKAWREKFKTE